MQPAFFLHTVLCKKFNCWLSEKRRICIEQQSRTYLTSTSVRLKEFKSKPSLRRQTEWWSTDSVKIHSKRIYIEQHFSRFIVHFVGVRHVFIVAPNVQRAKDANVRDSRKHNKHYKEYIYFLPHICLTKILNSIIIEKKNISQVIK